jgi:hypothetical protein
MSFMVVHFIMCMRMVLCVIVDDLLVALCSFRML